MSARKENWNEAAWDTGEPLTSPSRGTTEEQLEHLKERLLAPLLASIESSVLIQELRWAANEAAALAWFTVCPILVLPTLLEEKVSTALQRWERQQRLRRYSAPTKPARPSSSPCALIAPAVMAA